MPVSMSPHSHPRAAGGGFAADVEPWGGWRLPRARLLELGDAGAVCGELAVAADPERVTADPAGDAVNGGCPVAYDGVDAVGPPRRRRDRRGVPGGTTALQNARPLRGSG